VGFAAGEASAGGSPGAATAAAIGVVPVATRLTRKREVQPLARDPAVALGRATTLATAL